MHSSWHWKVSYLGLSQGWTLCAFMCFTNALCCPCSSRLGLGEVVLEKCAQHISRFFIPWLEVWLCFPAYCCCRAGGEQLPTCCRRILLLSLLWCTSSGGASSRHLQWKCLWCLCTCGSPKLTLKGALLEVCSWGEYCWNWELTDSCALTCTCFPKGVLTWGP